MKYYLIAITTVISVLFFSCKQSASTETAENTKHAVKKQATKRANNNQIAKPKIKKPTFKKPVGQKTAIQKNQFKKQTTRPVAKKQTTRPVAKKQLPKKITKPQTRVKPISRNVKNNIKKSNVFDADRFYNVSSPYWVGFKQKLKLNNKQLKDYVNIQKKYNKLTSSVDRINGKPNIKKLKQLETQKQQELIKKLGAPIANKIKKFNDDD